MDRAEGSSLTRANVDALPLRREESWAGVPQVGRSERRPDGPPFGQSARNVRSPDGHGGEPQRKMGADRIRFRAGPCDEVSDRLN